MKMNQPKIYRTTSLPNIFTYFFFELSNNLLNELKSTNTFWKKIIRLKFELENCAHLLVVKWFFLQFRTFRHLIITARFLVQAFKKTRKLISYLRTFITARGWPKMYPTIFISKKRLISCFSIVTEKVQKTLR